MTHDLTIEPIGETIEIEEGQSILDALLRNGIYIPYQCNHGRCSTCKIDVLDGEYDHNHASPFALMDFERDEGKALACCTTVTSDVTIEAEVEEDPDALYLPILDLTATVSAITDLTPDIKKVELTLPDDGMAFQAGQYINLHIPGMDEPRAFSIASPPSEPNRIELHIRLVPGGQGTSYLHETLAVGDTLDVTGPLGRFFVRKSADVPVLLLAGGSGLSSPQSMALDLLGEGFDKPVTLIHGVRGKKDIYHTEMFRDLEVLHPNFRYVVALSQPDDGDDWDGETGFVHDVAERVFDGAFAGWKAYLCGPPLMIEACIRTLMKGRLFEKDIYTEKFVSNADGADALARSPVFKRI